MSSTIDEATQRTSLSTSNQMEMLIFRLTDNQLYGINVFKIIEIVECPKRIDVVPVMRNPFTVYRLSKTGLWSFKRYGRN